MNIEHEDNQQKGHFYVFSNDKTLAEMTYVWASHTHIIIDHTFVDERLKGQNIGRQLLEKLVLFARAKKIKIIPLCPFAKAIMEKTKEYHDLL